MGVSGAYKYQVVTMPSGLTMTSSVDLGRAWENVYVEIPTMTSNTAIGMYGSYNGINFRRIFHPTVNQSTPATNQFFIASGATNCMVPCPSNFQYLKIVTTATVDDGASFRIIYSD